MIDLGTQPLGHTLSSVELDADRLDFLVETLDLVELPVVLDIFPRYDNPSEESEALHRGRVGLAAAGVYTDGRVHPDVEAWLRVLEQPLWYVSARLIPRPYVDEVPITRVCLASNGIDSVIGVRNGPTMTVSTTTKDAASEILDALGSATAFDFPGLSAPTDTLAKALDASPSDAHATARHLTDLDINPETALRLAGALSTCTAHAEITSVTVGSGSTYPGLHPVAFFDTPRGRIVATSSSASDGSRWSTLSSGSNAKMRSALTELIDRANNKGRP